MIDGELCGTEACARGLEGGGPEFAELLLIRFHPLPDIGRLIGAAFDVDEKRQIAADADRVEMIEEKEPVTAEEILNVVLRGDYRRVHSSLVEETVEARHVKWRRRGLSRRERKRRRPFRHTILPR